MMRRLALGEARVGSQLGPLSCMPSFFPVKKGSTMTRLNRRPGLRALFNLHLNPSGQ